MEETKSTYNKEKDTKYRKKVYEQIKKTGEKPQWVLNKNEYQKNYRKSRKSIVISVTKEEKERFSNLLEKKSLTKEQFIENIVNEYSSKQKGE